MRQHPVHVLFCVNEGHDQRQFAACIHQRCHLEQSSAARLLHIIAVSGNGQDIQSRNAHSSSPVSRVTFSLTMRRCAAISLICGSTRSTCSSVSMKVTTSGNLPPASTSVAVLSRVPPHVCSTSSR